MHPHLSTRRILLLAVGLACAVGCRNEKPNRSTPAAAKPGRDSSSPARLSQAEIVALRNRGVGYMGQFEYARAVDVYEQLLAQQPTSAEAKVDLAIALLNREKGTDLERAKKLLDEVIDADPANLRAQYSRGLLAYHDGQAAKARERFAKVAEGDPNDGYALYFLGQCLFTEGRIEEALREFQRAQEVDPYLRSAYYGAFQAAQRTGDKTLAQESLATFQRLADNPRARAAELKYTRMGPKAEVDVRREGHSISASMPDGPVFAPAVELPIVGASDARFVADPSQPPHVTVADFNGDGRSDLFLARAIELPDGGTGNAVLQHDGSTYRIELDHPLAFSQNVNAALWGDFDNDGLVDVYLCRSGPNQLWRQASPGEWADVTASAQADGGDVNTVDGACFDADHDGDLDYFLVNSDGPNDLLNNDRNGTFRSIGESHGLSGGGQGSRRVVVTDLDSDEDADIIVLRQSPPHEVFINDRLWEYRPGVQLAEFCNSSIDAAVAVDSDVDGQSELYAVGDGVLVRWAVQEDGSWKPQRLADVGSAGPRDAMKIAVCDFDGDTQVEILLQQGDELRPFSIEGKPQQEMTLPSVAGGVGLLATDEGPEVIACRQHAAPLKLSAGSGRFPFARIRLQGRIDQGAEMRSNASGIGVLAWARIGDRWAAIPPFRAESGPGQSSQLAAVGLGGAEKIDFLRLVWPDGVSQTELDLKPGQLHAISETQRQTGSCPLVFVWNGERFEFVADILGASGPGVSFPSGSAHVPRPEESVLIPAAKLGVQRGHYVVKLGEPMEEISYFDAVRLIAYDLPAGWNVALDERFPGTPPLPTGEAIFYRKEVFPRRATDGREQDVTSAIMQADQVAAAFGERDERFVGIAEPHHLTLEFAEPLDGLENPVLVFDGWVEYAYAQTAFAAWQAGTALMLPTIEARGSDGNWHVVTEHFGYMAGTSRRSAFPIDRLQLPKDTRELRISTNLQIYWDRIALVDREPCPAARRKELELVKAEVADVGFAQREMLDQRRVTYDYAQRAPLADARHPEGWYTRFGDARPLLAATDNAVAIIGPGEELHLEFAAGQPCPPGFERSFVLQTEGWCKDYDPFTKESGTVEPLPFRKELLTPSQEATRLRLHREFNTRFMSGW